MNPPLTTIRADNRWMTLQPGVTKLWFYAVAAAAFGGYVLPILQPSYMGIELAYPNLAVTFFQTGEPGGLMLWLAMTWPFAVCLGLWLVTMHVATVLRSVAAIALGATGLLTLGVLWWQMRGIEPSGFGVDATTVALTRLVQSWVGGYMLHWFGWALCFAVWLAMGARVHRLAQLVLLLGGATLLGLSLMWAVVPGTMSGAFTLAVGLDDFFSAAMGVGTWATIAATAAAVALMLWMLLKASPKDRQRHRPMVAMCMFIAIGLHAATLVFALTANLMEHYPNEGWVGVGGLMFVFKCTVWFGSLALVLGVGLTDLLIKLLAAAEAETAMLASTPGSGDAAPSPASTATPASTDATACAAVPAPVHVNVETGRDPQPPRETAGPQ